MMPPESPAAAVLSPETPPSGAPAGTVYGMRESEDAAAYPETVEESESERDSRSSLPTLFLTSGTVSPASREGTRDGSEQLWNDHTAKSVIKAIKIQVVLQKRILIGNNLQI